MWGFLFKVNSVFDDTNLITHHIIRADDFASAVKRIEDYFKNDLIEFSVKIIEDYCNEISETEYNRILEEC